MQKNGSNKMQLFRVRAYDHPDLYSAPPCPCCLPPTRADAALRQAGGKILVNLQLFDVYEEGALAEQGQRSLAFHAVGCSESAESSIRWVVERSEEREALRLEDEA